MVKTFITVMITNNFTDWHNNNTNSIAGYMTPMAIIVPVVITITINTIINFYYQYYNCCYFLNCYI